MCQFFSALVFRNGDVRFCEDDSHETLITRMGLDDSADLFLRGWVRVECVPPFQAVRVDETSVPGWYADMRVELDDRVRRMVERVAAARKVYDQTCAPARKVYDQTCAAARKVYDETCAAAWKVYDETCVPARKVYVDAISTMEGYVHDPTPDRR